MQYRFSRQAERDIEEIGDFIARDNPGRAVTFIAELRDRCRRIANAVSFDAFHCPWSVMAGLVPAICRGRVPLEMAGTSPAMTERTRVAMEGHWFGPLVQIAELPRAAPLRPRLGIGVRCIVFGRYLIFYVVHFRVLEIRRVLHGARNISADDVN